LNKRLSQLVLLTLLVLAFASRARADEPAASPAVISVPPPSTPPPANPKLEPQPDLSAFVGRPITAIDVSLDDDTWAMPALPKVTSVRPGQTMNGAAARRAIEDVLDTGRFARARVVAVADGSGVRMIVHVAQRRLIDTLRLNLHGAPIDRDELLREADLAEGGEVLGVEMPLYRARMERYFARRGFPTAAATIESRDTDDPARVLMIVDVSPGGARILQRRAFYLIDPDGAPSPSLRTLDPVLQGYRVPVGERADEEALDAADIAMVARLRALGYQKASLTHDLVFADDLVTLRVRVDIGPHFEPRFEGNAHYDSTALAAALDLDEETDLAAGHLLEKVKDFYVRRGFLDAEVTLETRGGGRDRIHLLVFHIVENRRVKVASRAYPCLKLDEVKNLSGGGPRSPGEIGGEIDSFLEEELPGSDLIEDPDPRGLDATITDPQGVRAGTRVPPLDLQPDSTFAPDTYDKAAVHVQELYRNEGYLHAEVGPVRVLRRACDRRSPAGRCIPLPLPASPPDACTYDATNLPLPVANLDPSFTCVPDPLRGVECEPEVTLSIPVKLGPRTVLYDMGFTGARAITEARLARATELTLGEPANTLKLEDARRKLIDLYKEEGYAYADVKYTLESSVDHTRARVRFDVVEGEQVIVTQIVIRGNTRTNDGVIRRRIAFELGKPYRTSGVRKTQERIATLNVFSNVGVALEEPYIPQRRKTVIVTVTERYPQGVEVAPGISTGEGIRGEFGYTHANIGGDAIGFAVRARLSYLPDFLIFDPVVKHNFDTLSTGFSGERLAARITGTISLPEIGFGPLVRGTIDGVAVHDLEHDFVLTKFAGIPTIYYRPLKELQFSLAQTFEHNDADIFAFGSISQYLQSVAANGSNAGDATELAQLLRFPDVPSHAFAQRFTISWDRRDNTFNPHKGTLLVTGVEHVDWYGEAEECTNGDCKTPFGHTFRFTQTAAVYIPLTKSITLAAELRTGENVQLTDGSTTYPDRLFFLGGVQSMRGYYLDSLVPQDYADQIQADYNKPASDPTKYTIAQVAIRGGNLMINPRAELRVPVHPPFDTVVFVDAGNIWQDPTYIFQHGIPLRWNAGTGLRIETPIGPLAFDYGFNLSLLFAPYYSARKSYEVAPGSFNFSIGLF
jgi:outer membrane protein insertion porin family